MTFTFAKGSLEVAPAFTATWRDPAQPASLDNKTGVEAGLSAKIPLGPKPPTTTEPSDTEKTRADASRLQDEQDKFRSGVTFKPGTADAGRAQAEKKAIDEVVRTPLTPGTSTPSQLIAHFDTSWNFDQIARQTTASFAASPGGTLQVVAFFTPVAGDTEAARAINGERQAAATEKADTTRQVLEKSIAAAKGRIRSTVELTGGGRVFGLPQTEAKTLGERQVAIIFIPGGGGGR
jgi:hypothetical protein